MLTLQVRESGSAGLEAKSKITASGLTFPRIACQSFTVAFRPAVSHIARP